MRCQSENSSYLCTVKDGLLWVCPPAERHAMRNTLDTVQLTNPAIAIVLALGLSNHWSSVVIAIIVIVLFVASRIVSKKMLDNIY